MTAITRYRGDTYAMAFQVLDSVSVPVDVTGSTFLMTVNSERSPKDTSHQIMQIAGVITDAALGKVSFTPTADQQVEILAGKYWYDVQWTDASGVITTQFFDQFVMKQDITK